MKPVRLTTTVALAAALLAGTATTAQADTGWNARPADTGWNISPTAAVAATGWAARPTGAYGHGTYTVKSTTYTTRYTVQDTSKDTSKDTHAVYLRLIPDYYSPTTGWASVGYAGAGYSKRIDNRKGYLKTVSGTFAINVYNHMNTVQRSLATKIRMEFKVCREVKGPKRDNCSTALSAPHDI